MNRFEDCEAWKLGAELTRLAFTITDSDSFRNEYGFRDQVRRAALSVPSNIAEGFERKGDREFVRFLSIARGSAAEFRSHLHIAKAIGLIDADQYEQMLTLCIRASAAIAGLMRYLRGQPKHPK